MKIFATLLLTLATQAGELQAQTFGPGTIGQVSITSGSGLVVGSTTIAPAAGLIGAQAIGPGILTLNPAAGSLPGPIAIQTTGNNAHGAEAINGGMLSIASSTFTTTVTTLGADAHGLISIGAGSTITANNTTISTSGANALGALAESGSSMTLTSVTIVASGQGAAARGGMLNLIGGSVTTTNAFALLSESLNGFGHLSAQGVTISTNSHGAVSFGTGDTLDISGSSVHTSGPNTFALYAQNGGLLNSQNNTILTQAQGAWGMNAEGGTLNSTNDKVTTTGDGAIGLVSRPSQFGPLIEGSLTATNVVVTTSGNSSHGAEAQQGSALTLQNGTVTTSGDGAHGLHAIGMGSVITANNANIFTSGTTAFGAAAEGGTSIALTGGSIEVSGNATIGANASGPGSTITLQNTQITVTSDEVSTKRSYGLTADVGGLVTASDASITSTGFGAYAVDARGGVLNLTGGSVTTTNEFAFGLLSESLNGLFGNLSAKGVTISTQGQSSQGAISFGTGDTLAISASTIKTSGLNAFGLYAQNGGQLNSQNNTILTQGQGAWGMNAEGGTLNSTNDKVTTTGDGAVGLISRPSQFGPLLEGALTATNVAVLTSGNAAHGAEAQLGSTLTATGGTIVTEGSGADGLLATGFGAQIAFNGGQVTTQGAQASGLLAQTSGLVNLMNTTVLTTGNSDTGVTLDTSGQISMLRGSVETQGSDGEAIFVTGSGQNQGSFDGTSVKSDHGTGILAQGSADSTLDFQNGASLTAGNGVLLLDQASGTVALNGTNGVQFVGNIDATGASGIANVTLRQNSSLTGAINQNQLTGAIGIAPAEPITGLPPQNVNLLVDPSKWNMTASSTLGQLEVFSGALININFLEANAGPFKTLVVSSLTGNGGIFAMNVDLPNFRGDLLVIQTPTAGFNQHQLQIGNPDQGHDPAPNRALLVAQSAQTSGLEFPSNQVEAGTFKYKTQRGDNTPATPNPNDWYLVRADETTQPTLTASSTPFPTPSPTPLPTPTPLPSPPHPTPTPTPTPGPSPTPRPTPTPSPTPPGGERQIDFPKPLDPQEALTNTANAAIGTYSSTIPIYYADMQTLVERMGELRLAIQAAPSSSQLTGGKGAAESKQPAPLPASPPTNEWGVWIRGFGSGMRINNDVSRVFDQNVGGFQLGADRRLASLWSGDIYLGVFGGYIYASRDFRDGGDGSTNALSLGTYATWIHPQGWYADMVVKYTQMWNTFSTPNLEGFISNGDYDIPAVGGSLEVGKRFELAGGRFFMEPQAQLAGVWEDGMDYTASNGLRVHGDDQSSLRGRLGGRVGMHFDLPQGRAIEPYARAEVIEEFLTGNTVKTNSTNFDSHLSGTTGRFGGGLTARISQSFYIYGEYDYVTGDHIEQPWSVDVGLRWRW